MKDTADSKAFWKTNKPNLIRKVPALAKLYFQKNGLF